MSVIIAAHNVCKNYGPQQVLFNLNLDVNQGSVFGLLPCPWSSRPWLPLVSSSSSGVGTNTYYPWWWCRTPTTRPFRACRRAPCERSATSSLEGHLVAFMRLRNSASSASGTFTRNGRILSAGCPALLGGTGIVVLFAWVPLGSWAFALGKSLPQSTKGATAMPVPAAAINFRKSRLDTQGLLLVESPRLSSNTYPETWDWS